MSGRPHGVSYAPWTTRQVEGLNAWQHAGYVHEFTCDHDHSTDRVLVASAEGWNCPTCDYAQTWAHNFMLDGATAQSNE